MRLNGLSSREVERSRKEYGLNSLTQMPQKPFIQRLVNVLKNPFMLVTMPVLVIQTLLFFMGHTSWIVPTGTLTAVIIIAVTSAISEGKNKRNAENAAADDKIKQSAKVVRDGSMMELPFGQVVVGDMVLLQTGDKIPADGEIVYGTITVDQTSLGGSAKAQKISAPERVKNHDTSNLDNQYYVHRGSVVLSGEAYMYIKAVGDKTLFGQQARKNGDSPVENLPKINWSRLWTRKLFLGYALSVCLLVGVLTVTTAGSAWDIYGILLTVSGLLSVLAVMGFCLTKGRRILTEGYVNDRLQKLFKKNLLVKDINILVKTGKIKVLLIDKTGIVTDGRFSVSEVAVGNGHVISNLHDISSKLLTEIGIGIGINNSSNASGMSAVGGDRTDKALLSYLIQSDVMGTVVKQNAVRFGGYDREKKYSAAVTAKSTYIKGEAKTILKMCRAYLDTDGTEKNLDHELVLSYISQQAKLGNRVVAAAKSDSHDSYTLICIVSLQDYVRSEIAEFVKDTRTQIIMLTSDSKECAKVAAENAGLLEKGEDVRTFSEITEQNLPELKVVAELLPKDKLKMVEWFGNQGISTAVLSDSVDDTETLEAADIGIAPQNGSEAAKQAADIIMLDDNILSLKQIIK